MKRLILSALLLVSASGWAQQDISRAFEHGVVTTERPQQRDIYIYTYDDLYPPPPPPPRSYFYYEGAGTVCRCGLGVRTTGGMHRRRAFIGIIRRRAVIIAKKDEAAIRDVLAAVPSVSTAVRPSVVWIGAAYRLMAGCRIVGRPSENLFV